MDRGEEEGEGAEPGAASAAEDDDDDDDGVEADDDDSSCLATMSPLTPERTKRRPSVVVTPILSPSESKAESKSKMRGTPMMEKGEEEMEDEEEGEDAPFSLANEVCHFMLPFVSKQWMTPLRSARTGERRGKEARGGGR